MFFKGVITSLARYYRAWFPLIDLRSCEVWVIFVTDMPCYTYMLRNRIIMNSIFDTKKQIRP